MRVKRARVRISDLPSPDRPGSDRVQVSRLGNPLVNEVVISAGLKDAFNSLSPDKDAGIPAVVQRVSVQPAELQQERPYIQNEIQFTRQAYGLNQVQTRNFGGDAPITSQDIATDQAPPERRGFVSVPGPGKTAALSSKSTSARPIS